MSGSGLQIPITVISENEMTHTFIHRLGMIQAFLYKLNNIARNYVVDGYQNNDLRDLNPAPTT